VPALLHIPTDRPRPAVQTHNGAIVHQALSSTTVKRAKEFALQNNLTPFMVFLAAQQLLLGRYAKQEDVCVAVPIAGRHLAGTERLVGFFINTLIMRNRFGDNPSVKTYLENTRDMVLGAFSHQDAPLDRVIEKLSIQRSTAYSPVVQIGFNYLVVAPGTQTTNSFRIDDLSIELIEPTEVEAKYDMIWGLQDSSDSGNYNLTVSIEFNTDLFTETTIQQYITHYEQLLNNMLTDVEMPVLRVGITYHKALLNELRLDSSEFDTVLPLTPMQRDLYLDTLVDPDNRRNYFGWIQQIPQAVDATLFQQAIDILTAHFSSLRMRIVSTTDIASTGKDYLDLAYAAILKPHATNAAIKVRQLDWSDKGYDQAAFIHHCNELAFVPYDLAQEPNLRFYLINAGNDRYAIVLTAHHACIDGVSLQSITELYTQVYAALGNTTSYKLPEDKYAEYVAAQIRQCDNAGSYHFWQQQAEHCDALSSHATTDKPALATKSSGQYQAIYYNDSAEHLSAIRQYCETHNTTPALYIKALYTLMLQSYCYTDSDFYFTDIIAARPKEHLREVGCYFEQRPTVIKADVLNQTSSFGKLLQHLNDYRTLSRGQSISNSLIDKLFNTSTPQFLFNFYLTERYLPFMDVMSTTTIIAPEMDNAVSLITVIDGDHLQFNLTYVDSQFEQNHFVERLLHLSQQILNGTEQLSALNLQLPAEQVSQQPVAEVVYNYGSVVAAITSQVKSTPDAIAVKDINRSLSYAELDHRANELAQYLVNVLHVQKGDNVALCLSANVDFMVALLATLKTGACYIPVDPHYPAGRIQHILNDAQARCIIAEQCSAEHIADIHTVKLFIDAERDAIAAQHATAPQVTIDLDDALYTIYTSGSTGLPKGASVKQRGELNLLQWYNREFAIGAGEKVLIISALGFDLTQKNLLGPLCAGATIILPEMDVYDPQAALQIIAKEHITLINCAPSAFYPLVENAAAFTQLQSLRVVLFGGEPIRMNALMGWLENPACVAQVVNMYGPTECTDISSFYRIEQPQQFLQQPVPIGHANDNVTLFVADSSLRLLPQGLVGELLVGGEGVGLGYRQLPEMTAEKFIDHPLAGKVYRTGDLVKQRDDGEYVFIGRIDHQVKLRGLRIELGEIEFALRQLPEVQDSLAMVNDDKLTGYILNHDGKVPENWRAVLGNFLPDYMMPQGIAALAAWPLSANGKIDRKALPALDGSRRSAFVAPRNDTEEKLAAIWREVLGVNEIGVYDSFFELGGHSLLVVRAVARIRDQFQQDIPLRDVFFTPTIAAIADLLAHAQSSCLAAATAAGSHSRTKNTAVIRATTLVVYRPAATRHGGLQYPVCVEAERHPRYPCAATGFCRSRCSP
jgi:amino acid adenylation domain-containing protein